MDEMLVLGVGEVFLLMAGLSPGMRESKPCFGYGLWSVFNQIKVELVTNIEGT